MACPKVSGNALGESAIVYCKTLGDVLISTVEGKRIGEARVAEEIDFLILEVL
jgi:hypothetical protein